MAPIFLSLPLFSFLLLYSEARAEEKLKAAPVEVLLEPRMVDDADTGIKIQEGFDIELLYSVPKAQGSWVAMAFDPKGRLIVSDQDDKGVFRVTLPRSKNKIEVESLKDFPFEPIQWGRRTVGGALGLLYAFDSLYMVTMKGLFRIRDTDGDDQFDEFKRLKNLKVGWEHSAHSIIKTADGKGLLLVSGNYNAIPKDVPSNLPPVWQKDSLLPSMPDQLGHAVSIKAPGGWVSRISPDGSDWKMIASGFRNPVDLAINPQGELFTFDSDLEFDVGSPWYRPTRVCHVTSGSEFGWRTGSAKWPEYFADSNGPVINVGPGSPTGISFGHHSNYPAKFQDKLFVCDWTFGTIYTINLEEKGSSYSGSKSEFLYGTPLNITAMRFGPDGNMYFLTGGRNTDSKLYRVKYVGKDKNENARRLIKNQKQRDLRKSLENLHQPQRDAMAAVEFAWPYLANEDRSIRYAARIAIENQKRDAWQQRALGEEEPRIVIYSMMALSRHSKTEFSEQIIAKLNQLNFISLSLEDRLALLRAYALCFMRNGIPSDEVAASVSAKLTPHYPASEDDTNVELCRVLSYLEAPGVVAKTIQLMKSTKTEAQAYDKAMLMRSSYGKEILASMSNTPNTRNIHYAYCLRTVTKGWTSDDRKYFFNWLNDTLKKEGGKSFSGYIRAIREEAITKLSEKEKLEIASLLGKIAAIDLAKLPEAKGPGKIWTVESANKLFKEPLYGRSFDNGKKMFAAGKCIACHRFSGEGGYSGPDLGSLGNRFSMNDIMVAILKPSQSISEQYQASEVNLRGGGVLFGRLISKSEDEVVIAPNPFDLSEVIKKPRSEVLSIKQSQSSLMPAGMIYGMNGDELKDLMAYLISAGDKKHKVFAPHRNSKN